VGWDEGGKRFVTRLPESRIDWDEMLESYRGDLVAEGVPESEALAEAGRRVERMKLRMAWFRERFQAFVDAEDAVGNYYVNYMDARPEVDWEAEDAPEVPEPAELQAVADALSAEIEAAQQGRWPRHLHFGDV
jgi:hypothetical protein